jgi:histidine phosphotransfer protein HptB
MIGSGKDWQMMDQMQDALVDWNRFGHARAQLGSNFWRVMGYLRDDGHKAVCTIEESLRANNAVGLVEPAELLKTEAEQMGAVAVAEVAEKIELQARDCVEWHQSPEWLVADVVQLRTMFEETVAMFEREASPLLERKAAIERTAELAVR